MFEEPSFGSGHVMFRDVCGKLKYGRVREK